MAQVKRPRSGGTEGTKEERPGSPATKVVLMELVRAGRPLSSAELGEQTLLSGTAVESALATLRDRGLCLVQTGDDRRPTRFEAELSPAATD